MLPIIIHKWASQLSLWGYNRALRRWRDENIFRLAKALGSEWQVRFHGIVSDGRYMAELRGPKGVWLSLHPTDDIHIRIDNRKVERRAFVLARLFGSEGQASIAIEDWLRGTPGGGMEIVRNRYDEQADELAVMIEASAQMAKSSIPEEKHMASFEKERREARVRVVALCHLRGETVEQAAAASYLPFPLVQEFYDDQNKRMGKIREA
jgi:hypothetical protein